MYDPGDGDLITNYISNFNPSDVEDYPLAISDLDNDSDVDVFSVSQYFEDILWYKNDGSGNFTPETILVNDRVFTINITDIDNDNDKDNNNNKHNNSHNQTKQPQNKWVVT